MLNQNHFGEIQVELLYGVPGEFHFDLLMHSEPLPHVHYPCQLYRSCERLRVNGTCVSGHLALVQLEASSLGRNEARGAALMGQQQLIQTALAILTISEKSDIGES
ncbi:MAG: hypothetical protein ACI8PT_002534 [Gammaproteobacteria bacterium]